MAIFPRRAIGQLVKRCATIVPESTVGDWLNRLDGRPEDRIPTEWEVAIIGSFMQFGNVAHEPEVEGSRLDLIFESAHHNLSFAADVVAISDRVAISSDPVLLLTEQLKKRFRHSKQSSGGLFLSVDGVQRAWSKGSKKPPKLTTVDLNFGHSVFTNKFHDFLQAIREEPNKQRIYTVRHPDPATYISITYNPRAAGVQSVTPGYYTQTKVLNSNPLFSALKTKAKKFKRNAYSGIKGVIVCDGGARILTDFPNWSAYSKQDVIFDWLRQNSSVSFVVTLGLRYGHGLQCEVVSQLFAQQEDEWMKRFSIVMEGVIKSLPKPVWTAENAESEMTRFKNREYERVERGGWHVKYGQGGISEIRISSKSLLDLLAGRLPQAAFVEQFKRNQGDEHNIFEIQRQQGRMFKAASVEHSESEDDDYVVLTFGGIDPALAKFRDALDKEKSSSS